MQSKNQLSAETLGQIALIQGMVAHLPNQTAILSFVCRGLEIIPGAGKVSYRLFDPESDEQILHTETQKTLNCFPIIFKEFVYGELLFQLSDPDLLKPYLPYLKNLSHMLGVIFEERRQRNLNETYKKDLEQRVYERTILLEKEIEKHLKTEEEKRKALEFSAEQSKLSLIGQVAGKMAHDFNNILMGIMGNAQLAVMDCDDQQIKEKLERIVAYSERGRDITNNLISYSKDQEPKQTYFKIEDKIDLILKMYEKELKDIEISRNYKPGIPKLLADPGMIQDVLANLLQNSIHAMSMVEIPRLKLKTYSQDDKVYFEIEDNGCGIPKEHQDSIFTPSFTLKGSHDKTGSYKLGIKGTGYGMSNVKKYIVEKHKGNIFLESEVGKCTKITIALKIIKNHLSPDEKNEVLKSQIFDKRRILLVEDEAAIADVQYQLLTKEPFNHVVSTAVNGQMAIDIFDRNKFDVVSLDYILPGNINGLDVYNHIRKNNGDIPVLFISGNIEFLESMKKLKEKDPNLEHLSKPVSNLEYVNKINELIWRTIKTKI